jgi:hypothetical protein
MAREQVAANPQGASMTTQHTNLTDLLAAIEAAEETTT